MFRMVLKRKAHQYSQTFNVVGFVNMNSEMRVLANKFVSVL